MKQKKVRVPLRRKGRIRKTLSGLVRYFLLIGISAVFLYPLLYMISNSLKSVEDLVNPTVDWLPSHLFWGNFRKALYTLQYEKTMPLTIGYVAIATLLQTLSCAMAGYAFARHEFPLKRLWTVMLVASFLIPAQVTLIPKYLMFYRYGLVNTPFSIWLPSLFGQGVNSTIFVLIFMSFFQSYPKSFDEAAQLDGAGCFKIFFRVALPLVTPAIIVSILFSFVWFWNETYTASLLLGSSMRTLPMKLESFVAEFTSIYAASTGDFSARLNESMRMSATLLVIAPLMILYAVLQRRFVQGIDAASGLTGE